MEETFSVLCRNFWLVVLPFVLGGCVFTPTAPQAISALTSVAATPTPAVTVAGGVKAVKIYFQASTNSSFDAPSSNLLGTVAAVGSGLQAKRIYNGDGSALALRGTTDPSWPAWLTSFEIGVSGSSNASATNAHCANFVYSTEAISTRDCKTPLGVTYNCGAPLNQFRVSEWDCTGASVGNGGPSDGIYFRAVFNRATTALGTNENILAVIEYSASALNAAPTNPLNCFSGGIFTPESCSDFTWRAYLKRSALDTVQPFLVMVPPISSSSLQAGTGLVAKQIFLPIAADPTFTTFQLSRTGSILTPATTNFSTQCLNARSTGDSPLCAGMIFYSITFFRI
ncbi:MAG: hypothetical protein ABI041_00160 [Bdellovibrionia bacterium]